MDFKVISFSKSDDGKLTVESWGSIQQWDSQKETIDLASAMRSAPIMMALRPKVHLGHTDVEVGEITDLQMSSYRDDKTGEDLPGVKVKSEYYNAFRIHKMVQRAIKNGTLDSLSMRGFSYNNVNVPLGDGSTGKLRSDVEMLTFALCSNSSAINKKAKHIKVDGQELKKADEFELELLKDDTYNSLITSLLHDGMPYTKAKQVAYEMYSETNPIRKADIDEVELEVLKKAGDEMTEIDDMKKEVALLKEQVAKAVAESEAIKKERDEAIKKMEGLQMVADKTAKGDESPLPTQVNEMDFIKKATSSDEFKKAVVEIMKANEETVLKTFGFVKASDKQSNPVGDIADFADKNPEVFISAINKANNAVMNKNTTFKSAKEMAEEIRKSQ